MTGPAMNSRARGFTLVELLLAVSLLSMLLALAYGGMRASTRATDRGQAILEESSTLRMAHQFVRRQLNQMVPLSFAEGSEDGQETIFQGESNRVRYVAPMPGYLGFGGPQVQELSIRDGDNGRELVLRHALLQGFEEARLDDRAPILLLDGIDDAGFEFLGRDETGQITNWMTSWQEPWILPVSVSLDIVFEEERYVEWPMLTSTVRIDPTAILELKNAGEPSAYSTTIQDLINKRRNQN